MSAENVEIVRRMCEAYAHGDWAAAAEPLDPDIEWDASTYMSWPDSPTFRGKDGVLGRGSGVEVSRTFAQVWRMRDGKAVAWAAYPDRESALAAVGGER